MKPALFLFVVFFAMRASAQVADPSMIKVADPARVPQYGVSAASSPRFQSLIAPRTLAMWYHDSSKARILWRIPSSYQGFSTHNIGERFDLPGDKGYLDSIHIFITELPLGKMRFDVKRDTLKKRVVSDVEMFHYPNYWSPLSTVDTAKLRAGAQDTGRMVTIRFNHKEVEKYFHIIASPDVDSGITSLFGIITDAQEGDLATITPDNARSHMLWNIQGSLVPVHMRGRFQDFQDRYLSPGLYVVAFVEVDGSTGSETIALPSVAALHQGYPHPAAAEMRFPFSLSKRGRARIDVFDARGVFVATAADAEFEQGEHTVRFDTSRLAPGAYTLRLTSDGEQTTRTINVTR